MGPRESLPPTIDGPREFVSAQPNRHSSRRAVAAATALPLAPHEGPREGSGWHSVARARRGVVLAKPWPSTAIPPRCGRSSRDGPHCP